MSKDKITKAEFIRNYVSMMRSGNATIFIGAGLSLQAGMPSWFELLKDAAISVGLLLDEKQQYDFFDIADLYVQANRHYAPLLDRIVKILPKDAVPTPNHDIIARLPLKKVWTSNFDNLLEKSFEAKGKRVNVLRRDLDFTVSKTQEVKVYKVHGCIEIPQEIIITREHVNQYYRTHEIMSNAFFSNLAENTFLFIGFGFNDFNFKTIIGRIQTNYKENSRQHFAILRRPLSKNTEDIIMFDLTVASLSKYGIKVIEIQDYAEISLILKGIEKVFIRKNVFIAGSFDKYAYLKNCPLDKMFAPAISDAAGINASHCMEISTQKKFPFSDEKKDLRKYLTETGTELIKKDFTLYTGYGIGVCDEVIEGASRELYKSENYGEVTQRLKIFPLPGKTSIDRFQDKIYRMNMIGSCGIMLINHGYPHHSDYYSGTLQEYYLAKELTALMVDKQESIISNFTNLKKDSTGEFTRLYLEQVELICYKHEELTHLFTRIFFEQWKLIVLQIPRYLDRIEEISGLLRQQESPFHKQMIDFDFDLSNWADVRKKLRRGY